MATVLERRRTTIAATSRLSLPGTSACSRYAFVAVRFLRRRRRAGGLFLVSGELVTACDRLDVSGFGCALSREQTMRFADQNELFPVSYTAGCLRHEIGRCLAPCAAACSQADYAFHVSAAGDFLEGRDRTSGSMPWSDKSPSLQRTYASSRPPH
jgi:hypothetical protein